MDAGSEGRFGGVPDDVVMLVLARLDAASLDQAGAVCRRWRAIVSDDSSWKRALVQAFGRAPAERLDAARMPGRLDGRGGAVLDGAAGPWRGELVGRWRLQAQWRRGGARREYATRLSGADALVASEQQGWVLAVSAASRAAVRSNPRTGKVHARDDGADIIMASTGVAAVCGVAARLDRVAWALADGRTSVTHLTRQGALQRRVESQALAGERAVAAAGVYDALAQASLEWRARYGLHGADDVASAGDAGGVLVWSPADGRTRHVLGAGARVPLSHVTWADRGRYVVALSQAAGALCIWDLQGAAPGAAAAYDRVPELRPPRDEAPERRRPDLVVPVDPGPAVLLAGDPFGAAFVLATERRVVRMRVDGSATAFDVAGTAAITAATWHVDVGRTQAARVLAVGDAAGCVWLFDGDSGARLARRAQHRTAVAALAVNAAVVASAARDGQLCVADAVSGGVLSLSRCRSGRRRGSPAGPGAQHWSLHSYLLWPGALQEQRRARLVASRTSAAWADQVRGGVDTLDRRGEGTLDALGARFPSAVSCVVAGYAWVVAANGAHVHAAFADHVPAPSLAPPRRVRCTSGEALDELLAEGLAEARIASDRDRTQRLRRHAQRQHVEQAFDLAGLSPDEQMAYALWLSAESSAPTSAAEDSRSSEPAEHMSEDEQIALALRLSRLTS
ncbi:hypothetical protein LPJ63_003635 [Coemansia sp. RSA 2711]|nr:hypothetical protein LPJ63_003635 [Coemansia sp. RSA 2711]